MIKGLNRTSPLNRTTYGYLASDSQGCAPMARSGNQTTGSAISALFSRSHSAS